MVFEWDENKNKINIQKHGISFKEAREVFADPFAVTRWDRSQKEARQQIIGHIHGILLTLVVYTAREDTTEETVRIISARKATTGERNIQRVGFADEVSRRAMKRVRGFEPLDEETKKRLEALASLPDSEIDTSDIHEWTEEDFKDAVPFQSLYRPRKEQITARLDADVLAWLKSYGKGYQTRMNELLRKEMLQEKKKLA